MAGESKNSLYLIGIVAIVAIVGMFTMVGIYKNSIAPQSAGRASVPSEKPNSNLVGQGASLGMFDVHNQSIIVLNPNGGEKLPIGSFYNITWTGGDSFVNIGLTDFKTLTAVLASHISNTGSFYWNTQDIYGNQIPTGYYGIAIWDDHNPHDISDGPFYLFQPPSINRKPKITQVSPLPEIVRLNENVGFFRAASDPDGDYLSWSISFGDGSGVNGKCPSTSENNKFDMYHAWQSPGSYLVYTQVSDCKEDNSFDDYTVNITVQGISNFTNSTAVR